MVQAHPPKGFDGVSEHPLTIKKARRKSILRAFLKYGSGGWIRTNDLRVMSPTSYQTAPPRNICKLFYQYIENNLQVKAFKAPVSLLSLTAAAPRQHPEAAALFQPRPAAQAESSHRGLQMPAPYSPGQAACGALSCISHAQFLCSPFSVHR